jgi:RNA-binding protein
LSHPHPATEGTTPSYHMLQLWQAHAHTAKGGEKGMITSKIRRRIKRELSSEKSTIRIGKNGTTKQVIGEISRQLEKKEMVKIKMLKSALRNKEAKAIASKIAQQTRASLVDVRGHTIMLYKQRKRRNEKSV